MAAEAEADKKAAGAAETEEKEAKEEAKEETKEEAKAEPEKPKEPTKPKDPEDIAVEEEMRPKIAAGAAAINAAESTLNVMPTGNGKLLMSLMEGGLQFLLAGARTTVGMKSGRYLVEVKIVESHKAADLQGPQGKAPQPRNLVRLGLSHAGTSLFLGDGSSDNLCFDSEGFFMHEKTKKKVTQNSQRDSVMGMLVNLDEGSPNANTVSFFRNGQRACEPLAIPEALRGKPLFPTVTYKNVTLQLNCGSVPMSPLPFKCHMLSDAAEADVEVVTVPEPKGGKCDVLFPVGLPEDGFFDWVDSFLAQNPDFTELSDRKILDWAAKSGLVQPKVLGSSTDKPDMKFGIPAMDDSSIRRLLHHIAPTARRNFIVPELKANLVASERKQGLARFPASEFRKVAAVFAGEPTAEFKEQVQGLILADKKKAAEAEQKKKREEEARKRLLEVNKKKAEEVRKGLLKRKKEGEEEPAADEEKAEEPIPEPMEVEVELTEEEKAQCFRKRDIPNVSEQVLAKSYADFTFPTSDEGFDEVSYKWQSEESAAKVLKDWIFAKKLMQRVDDIQPGASFKEEWTKWSKVVLEWKKKQSDWKDPIKKKALLKARAEAKKKEAEEKGDEAPQDAAEIDIEEVDTSAVEDVTDIGSGEPLFSNFGHEDWVMLSTRYEFHLLLHSFKKDLDDPDRPNFAAKDLPFYYQKYFKKAFNIRSFGMDAIERLMLVMKTSVTLNKETSFLEAVLAEDAPVEKFVKQAEDHRRERQRRMDAGDETAELKFPKVGATPLRPTVGSAMGAPGTVGQLRPRPGLVPRGPGAAGYAPPAGSVLAGQKRPPGPITSGYASFVAKQPRTFLGRR